MFIETIESFNNPELTLRAKRIVEKLDLRQEQFEFTCRTVEQDSHALENIEAAFEKAISTGNPIVIDAVRQKLRSLKENNIRLCDALDMVV